MLFMDWNELTMRLATKWRVVYRGSQILWVVPHEICGGWMVQSPKVTYPCYAHEGD